MSWLFGSGGKASDEESVRARHRIEELHRFYQSKLTTLQAEIASLRQDHAEDMRAKEATAAELARQKQESDQWAAQLQDKLLHLSQELAYSNLQLQHREQEVLRSARAMVAHDFAQPDTHDGATAAAAAAAAAAAPRRSREGKSRRGDAAANTIAGGAGGAGGAAGAGGAGAAGTGAASTADDAALGDSQARMRELAEARHRRALAALEDRYKGVLEDQKRRHHRALADAAAEREEAVAAAAKQHAREVAALQVRHEQALRHFHGRLMAGGGVPFRALAQLTTASQAHDGGESGDAAGGDAGATAAPGAAASPGALGEGTGASIAAADGGADVASADMQALLRRLEGGGRDGMVSKLIMQQIVLSLVKSTSKAHTQEVLGLAATVLDFSPFQRLDAGLPDDPTGASGSGGSGGGSGGGGGGGKGMLRTIFGFGGGGGDDGGDGARAGAGGGPGTPTGDDPRATTVAIAAVKALVLAYVNEEDQGEQHALLNELSRLLRFSHDERQSCSLLRESQRLVSGGSTTGGGDGGGMVVVAASGGDNGAGDPSWWFGGSSGPGADNDAAAAAVAVAATTPSLEEQCLAFLRFRRWGRVGELDYNLAWELARLRRLGGGGKRGTAVRDTVRYERRLLATLRRHKESLAAQQFNAGSKQWIQAARDLGVLPPARRPQPPPAERVEASNGNSNSDSNSDTNDDARSVAAAAGGGDDTAGCEACDVATFLRKLPGLDKRAIGDWLSEPADRFPFHDRVLRAFTASFDFAQLGYSGTFCGALREFLVSFRLPGEAQKIDRLMEAFARELFRAANAAAPRAGKVGDSATTASSSVGAVALGKTSTPGGGGGAGDLAGVFASADAVYVLAFSTVMLNTDLHSPQMEDSRRMSLDAFVSNNRGINDEADLPRPFLEDVYRDIKATEIKKDCDPYTS